MKSTKDAMLPNIVKVSDPIVTGVDPVPDDSISQESSKETYSEGGLSGEASVRTEPFMLRQRTDEEIADYDKGFACGQSGGQNDDTKNQAWQRGWAEAQK
ncbi:hypothetical protein [Tunturiibacter psychrotolerans]|jgi:hypothetical protein|uniref:hypothetical protein n=1 Tax=Tunturiibacter psychrotolerans TaxID=3069686 RepID=UPI003D1AF7C2